jgi:hypothetical protein
MEFLEGPAAGFEDLDEKKTFFSGAHYGHTSESATQATNKKNYATSFDANLDPSSLNIIFLLFYRPEFSGFLFRGLRINFIYSLLFRHAVSPFPRFVAET